mmetsp:Transcript_34395/g.75252  ORF Transcript_34395/g.75252 Transcript_34395/m.75252 type:complete len:396 (+) Transcript_34395:204-1391(+)
MRFGLLLAALLTHQAGAQQADPVPPGEEQSAAADILADATNVTVDPEWRASLDSTWKATWGQPPGMLDKPRLDPEAHFQPYDTAIGNLVVRRFMARAGETTSQPPPTQEQIDADLARLCPNLTLPSEFMVQAPRCGDRFGGWFDTQHHSIATWSEPAMEIVNGNMNINVNGQMLGSVAPELVEGGGVLQVADCMGQPLYNLMERVTWHKAETSVRLCRDYGSCSGTYYMQYTITQFGSNVVLAATNPPYLEMFPSQFEIVAHNGATLAQVSKAGDWKDNEICPDWQKKWVVKLAEGSPSKYFTAGETRWVLGAMMTAIAARNARRNPDASVGATVNVHMSRMWYALYFLFIVAVVVVWLKFVQPKMAPKILRFLTKVEHAFFPSCRYVPDKFQRL